MNIVGNLPLELAQDILGRLPPKDLWSCMSVDKSWRLLANSNFLWKKHLIDFDFDDELDELYSATDDGVNPFNLCLSSKRWKEVHHTLKNWKERRFKEIAFPTPLYHPTFYSHGCTIAALESTMKIKLFKVMDDCLLLTSQIYLPLKKNEVLDDLASLFMSKEYLVYKDCSILLVYKKENSYSLKAVLQINKLGSIDFLNKNSLEYFPRLIVDEIAYIDFSYLYKEKLWISFSNGENEFHFLINLETSEIKKIIPTVDGVVYHCKGFKNKVILEYETKVVVYDLCGTYIFMREFEEIYLSLNSNSKILAVFTPSKIIVVNMNTGEDMFFIMNDFYMPPHVYVHPVRDIIYLTANMSKALAISAFSNTTGTEDKRLWTNLIRLDPGQKIGGKFFFIYGIYLIVFIEYPNFFRKVVPCFLIYFINSITGETVQSGRYFDVQHFKPNFFIEGKKHLLLSKVN